ncbi:AraC family transcriptional regulator, partial [bacterium]
REGTLHLEEEDQEFELNAGQTLLLLPHRLHRGTRDYGPNLKFYWLHFTLRPDGAEGSMCQPTVEVPQFCTVTRPDYVTELFRRYLHDQETGRLRPLSASLLAWMILTEIADIRPAADTRAAAVLAGRAYTHIQTHFHEKLSASDIARAVGCNPQYLSRIFQEIYRHSLTDGIRRARINHAKSLLIHTNYNVSEVARLSGFEDPTYFQRVFKKLEDTTPLRYQRTRARVPVNNS